MSERPRCTLCGEPMPPGEEIFKYHGYSSDCPKPPLPKPEPIDWKARAEKAEEHLATATRVAERLEVELGKEFTALRKAEAERDHLRGQLALKVNWRLAHAIQRIQELGDEIANIIAAYKSEALSIPIPSDTDLKNESPLTGRKSVTGSLSPEALANVLAYDGPENNGYVAPSDTGEVRTPELCEGCPPVGYPTEKTRCLPCPLRPKQVSP